MMPPLIPCWGVATASGCVTSDVAFTILGVPEPQLGDAYQLIMRIAHKETQ